jgi:hypothetical protein
MQTGKTEWKIAKDFVSKSSFIPRLKCAVILFLRVLEAFGSRLDLETGTALCISLDLMFDVF